MEKRFFNKPEDCVNDSLNGFVKLYPGLYHHEPYRFVTKSELKITNNVAVVSGGGSGHEPFCTGYVGNGMLAGVVAGNVFASPPKSHIIQCIRYLHKYYKGGVLIIIPNYTGDRLNFGMAVESAKGENLNVKSIAIGEDYASKDNPIIGRRGMCGLLFAYKIAGALSNKGESLESILSVIERLSTEMKTIGISSQPCSLPGQKALFAISNDELELGTGVHGEAGIRRVKYSSAASAVRTVIDSLELPDERSSIVVLVNNLGTTTEIELNIICGEVYSQLTSRGKIISRMYSGPLMTSLDMAGFQISILNLADDVQTNWVELLDESTDAPRWIGSTMSIPRQNPSKITYDEDCNQNEKRGFKLSTVNAELLKACFNSMSLKLIENEAKLNDLDSGCGDGDCGTTLKNLASGVRKILEDAEWEYPCVLLQKLASIAENEMGGTSGAIYSLCFSSMRNFMLSKSTGETCLIWIEAFLEGVECIKKYGRAQEGDRTMIDALEPAVRSFRAAVSRKDVKGGLLEATNSAIEGCEKTRGMKARAGRASYVHEDNIRDVDAGAYAVVLCLKSLYECF